MTEREEREEREKLINDRSRKLNLTRDQLEQHSKEMEEIESKEGKNSLPGLVKRMNFITLLFTQMDSDSSLN